MLLLYNELTYALTDLPYKTGIFAGSFALQAGQGFGLFFWSFSFPALTDALAGLPYRTGRFARSFALQDHSKEGSIVAPFKANAETLIQINAHGPLFTFGGPCDVSCRRRLTNSSYYFC